MSRRIMEQLEIPPTKEGDKLGGILKLIENQQDELEGCITRIEQAHRDIERLNNKKIELDAQFPELEEKVEKTRQNTEREITELNQQTKNERDKLTEIKLKNGEEIKLLNQKLEEINKKIKIESNSFDDILKRHQSEYKLAVDSKEKMLNENIRLQEFNENLNKEKDRIENDKTALQVNIDSLRSQIQELISGTINKEKEYTILIKTTEDIIRRLKNEIKELSDTKELETIKLKKYKDDKTKEINSLIDKSKKQLESIEEEIKNRTPKLESLREEFQKIEKTIVHFSNKKEEIERRENILKKKYNDAGFPWS